MAAYSYNVKFDKFIVYTHRRTYKDIVTIDVLIMLYGQLQRCGDVGITILVYKYHLLYNIITYKCILLHL